MRWDVLMEKHWDVEFKWKALATTAIWYVKVIFFFSILFYFILFSLGLYLDFFVYNCTFLIYFNCFYNLFFRSCGGWSNGGQIAGEIHRPGKSFLRAVIIVMLLTLCFSLFPIAAAICALPGKYSLLSPLSFSFSSSHSFFSLGVHNWTQFKVGDWAKVAGIHFFFNIILFLFCIQLFT
jgi:hypothetical protein